VKKAGQQGDPVFGVDVDACASACTEHVKEQDARLVAEVATMPIQVGHVPIIGSRG